MNIKICGLFREQDIDYVNEARPDYIGFVLAESRRKVSPVRAAALRGRLDDGIVPVGVFVNAPIADIAALYRDGVIAMAQLHGDEDAGYIARLQEESARDGQGPVPVIKALAAGQPGTGAARAFPGNADYYLLDNAVGGSGRSFDWGIIEKLRAGDSPLSVVLNERPWFLAGGIGPDTIGQALGTGAFGLDVSSGAETDGVKDREKIVQLTAMAHKGKGI